MFASLRTGAANVAGVSYQIAVSVLLLASGCAATIPGLPVRAVRPEGLEDIDCLLDDGSLLFVQTKERGPGARAIAVAELADIIAHAAQALRLTSSPTSRGRFGQGDEEPPMNPAGDVAPPPSRFAVVTDGRFGSSLPSTGWTTSLAEALTGAPDGMGLRQSLLTAIETRLADIGVPKTLGIELLQRTHLVVAPSDLATQTAQLLQTGLSLHPALASIARAELLRDLAEMAARQREARLVTAKHRTRADLDTIITRLRQAVDVASLDEAIRAGVCEPADYVSASPVDMASFLHGVDVTPAHIAAGLDVLRPEESAAILEGLATRRHAVVAGPSGSGKSALVWRTARLVERGPQLVRVLRVADLDDTELLVRHVRRLMPAADAPVLVCVDDLGRARMAAWPEARRRLSELPGVLILGAVRREDLTPDISADATVIDPYLTDTAAGQIYDAIVTAGLPTILEREEALQRADGLLMEFVALTTTGRRIRDVLAIQVAALANPARRLQREALRLVCAAHTLGFAVSADALPAALSAEPAEVGDALTSLDGEHLLVRTGHAWQGLHDLRTELLLDLLHTVPPPTLAATYGGTLTLLPEAAQAPAARRAAVRLARVTAADHAGLPVTERLVSLHETLHPVAVALGQRLTHLAARSPSDTASARYLAGLLEAADRLDTIAYAHAVLPFLEEHRPPTLDVAKLALLTYSAAVNGVRYDIDGLQGMVQLARQLPAPTSPCARIVAEVLPAELVARLATAADLPTAVRLCEAAEPFTTLTAEQATAIYRAHVPALPHPPGSDDDIERADRRAQLTASLTSLARLHGPAVAQAFGPPLPRAEDAVASDPYGCHVELALRPVEPIPDTVSNLARTSTYTAEEMLVVRATAFARAGTTPLASAYRSQPGDDPTSINGQVVLLIRRIFDACPDADLVNAEIWQANKRPQRVQDHDEGVKSIRAGVLKRDRDTARSVAFQAAVIEALSAENWTTRLRRQAEVARQLVVLLEQLPARLRPSDNRARRSEWMRRVEEAAAAVAALPGRPPQRQAVLGSAQAAMLAGKAADLDLELRAKDAAKSALDLLAGALAQVARGLNDPAAKRGAGLRLAEVPRQLQQARDEGAPAFAGLGDTLPQSLDALAAFGARLLTALGEPALDRILRRGRIAQAELDAVLGGLARETCERDREAVVDRLSAAGVTAEAISAPDPNPITPWQDQRTVILVDIDDWHTVVDTLQRWAGADRETAGVSGRAMILPTADGVLMPLGLHFFGAHGNVLPLPADGLPELSAALNLPLRTGSTSAAPTQPSEQLVRFSYERIRRASRATAWNSVPAHAPAPDQVAEELSAHFATVLTHLDSDDELEPPESYEAVTAQAMLQLCDVVAAETGEDAGLAHQLADIDITALGVPEPGSAAYLFDLAHTAALEADRAAFHAPATNSPSS